MNENYIIGGVGRGGGCNVGCFVNKCFWFDLKYYNISFYIFIKCIII